MTRRLFAAVLLTLTLATPAAAQTSGWQQTAMPKAARGWDLLDVTTFSTSKAFAVGQDQNGAAMVARYNGTTWREVSHLDAPSVLRAVSRTPTGTAWAVGYSDPNDYDSAPVASHYDGSGWHPSMPLAPTAQSSNLYGVSAVSDHNVWAVGSYTNDYYGSSTSLVEHWNGSAWRIIPSPNPNPGYINDLVTVAATPDGGVFAAGYQGSGLTPPILIHRVAGHWRNLPLPKLPGYDWGISGSAATSKTNVWFVGSYQRDSDAASRGFALHWDGTKLTVYPVQQPRAWAHSYLSDVTIARDGRVYGVGTAYDDYTSEATAWRLGRYGFAVTSTPSVSGNLYAVSAGRGGVISVGTAYPGGAIGERLNR